MATLDELVVRIKADASQLERELKRVSGVTQQETNRMGGALSGLASQFRALVPALSAAAIVTFAKRSIDAAGRMKDLGDQIGFAATTLSALERPLVMAGTTLDQFAAAVNLMNANIGQAASGNDQMAESFARLGLSIEDLKRMSPEEQFYAITSALAAVKTQYEQTELGRAIFGRGFSALIPLIKEANGNLDEHVQKLKDTKDALDQETIDRIDAFGDAMASAAIKAKNEFLDLFAAVLKVSDFIYDSFGKGAAQGGFANWKTGLPPAANSNTPSFTGMSDDEVARIIREGTQPKGVNRTGGGAKGVSDAERERNRIMDEGRRITEQNRTAYEKYTESVQRAGELREKNAIDEQTYQRELIRLQQELNGEIADGSTKAADQAIISAKIIKDSFGDALESVMFDFKNLGDSATSILNGIARNIARSQIIDPLSNSLSGGVGGIIGSLFGGGDVNSAVKASVAAHSGIGGYYADGGSPPVGVPSVVGERGAEIFVPRTAGTIIPNHALGGSSVSVVHQWNISAGVTRQELASMIPMIEQRSTAATLAAMEKGGKASQIVGRRS